MKYLTIIINLLYLANCEPIIIPFHNNLNKTYQNLKEYISIIEYNFFQTNLYIGKPSQKINNIGILISYHNSLIKLFVKSRKYGDGYDAMKSNSINNYTYEANLESEFIEYGIFNDTIYFGNRYFNEEEYKGQFINFIQLNQKDLYVPTNGFVALEYSKFVNFEYFDSDKGIIITFDDYPHKYNLRYKENDLEKLQFDYVEFGDKKIYDIIKFIFSAGNFVQLNSAYSYYFDSLLSCSKIFFDDKYYFKCNEKVDTSAIKITLGNLVLDENDLVIKVDNYKIPLIKFGDFDKNSINFGILYTKKFNLLKIVNNEDFELVRYKTKYTVNMPINILEKLPFSNSFIFKEKSPDGNDIFPIRFLHEIDENNLENLDINIIFKNYNSGFIIELYVIVEDLIEALKKGILIEKFYDDKIISNKLHFLILKDKIIGKMIDNEKKYYIYIIIKKSQYNNNKFDSIQSDISINFDHKKIMSPNMSFSGIIQENEEIQLFFSDISPKFNAPKNNENNTIESLDKKRLFLHITLENSLDYAIINRTTFESVDKIDYYKNSTEFDGFDEYLDKIIIYIDIFNKNLSDLMINIFTKSDKKNFINKGYKIKYYIGKIFDYPYYALPDDKKIKYEKNILNNTLAINITIPNIEKYVYGIYMGISNFTITIIKIFEIDLNISLDITKPIIFFEYYNAIYSKEILSKNKSIIINDIDGIKVNLDKKQYLIITYANISEINDIISYDSFLIKKENNELNEDSHITIIIIVVLIIIILIMIVIYILFRKGIFRNIFKKNEEADESQKKSIPLVKINN